VGRAKQEERVSKNAELTSLEAALHELPIFPLPQVVLFPRALLPLHIFEPRYRTMLKDALETHRAMAMALIDPSGLTPQAGASGLTPQAGASGLTPQAGASGLTPQAGAPSGAKTSHDQPSIRTIAGAGVILEHQELPDGRSNVVLHGVARVRLEELPFVPPYRRARATILHEVTTPVPAADRAALLAEATSFAGEVHKRDPSFVFRLPPSLEPGAVADLCAHHLVIDAAARQRILEALDTLERVRLVTAELAVQHGALRTSERSTLH
jgi:ATP-dependent Lon protease